jgi:hypothetical protein
LQISGYGPEVSSDAPRNDVSSAVLQAGGNAGFSNPRNLQVAPSFSGAHASERARSPP